MSSFRKRIRHLQALARISWQTALEAIRRHGRGAAELRDEYRWPIERVDAFLYDRMLDDEYRSVSLANGAAHVVSCEGCRKACFVADPSQAGRCAACVSGMVPAPWFRADVLNALGPRAWAALAARAARRFVPAFPADVFPAEYPTLEAAVAYAEAIATSKADATHHENAASWRAYEASEKALDLRGRAERLFPADEARTNAVRAAVCAATAASRAAAIIDGFGLVVGTPEVEDLFCVVFDGWSLLACEREAFEATRADMNWLRDRVSPEATVPPAFFERPLWPVGEPAIWRARIAEQNCLVKSVALGTDAITRVVTNDIRKGSRVRLRSGTVIEVLDNRRGNGRLARVPTPQGDEVATVPAWEFSELSRTDGTWCAVELTPSQFRARAQSERLGV